MKRTGAVVVCCLVALACNSERRRLMEHLVTLEQQQKVLEERRESRRTALRDSEARLDALNRDLTTYNTEVHAFINNHKIATACIGASRTTWGENNAFANEVSAASRFGAALCGVALLNGDFAREVSYVAEKLGEADTRVKELNEQIARTRRTVDDDRARLRDEESAADQLELEMAGIRQRLGLQ